MEIKNCSYAVVSNGELSKFTTSCSLEKRGGFSKIIFSNGAVSYAFLIGKSAVSITTSGEANYSFTLKKGEQDYFDLISYGATFKAQVLCKSLFITEKNNLIEVSASYEINLSGNVNKVEFLLTVK